MRAQHSLMHRLLIPVVAAAVLGLSSPSVAQLRSEVVVSGLTHPVGFVQDPSDPAVQYVVQQEGVIRVVRNGTLVATPFLDLSGAISTGGERGLLGVAFPRDYASRGRLYVNFTNTAGHTVVARFARSSANPLVADPSSRFDLRWSTGERMIRQPFTNHNGGQLAFGPDGFLYVGMGDGGSGNDPNHLAQTPSSLLGKMLRIDVNVVDADPNGFNVPAGNPFIGMSGVAPEIWSFGLRNPWRFSFDDPARGGTGAMLIGDVGQSAWEEIDYEPAGRGGRNYGWRNREGAHDNVTSLPPAYQPLIDPVFEYSHSIGRSITGGYVYRGSSLGASFRGRYFFADFVAGRVWSVALNTTSTGEASASDLREHTAALGGGAVLGLISSFGVDAQGELYVVSWSRGTVLRIGAFRQPSPHMHVDVPANGARVRQPFVIAGWAVDATATDDPGIDTVHVWAYPASGAPPVFAGAHYGGARPDIAAVFGPHFSASGFGVVVSGLAPGAYRLVAFGRLRATGTFDAVRVVDVAIESSAVVVIDTPVPLQTIDSAFLIAGWAVDPTAPIDTGIDVIHIYAYPVSTGGGPVFLGAASRGGIRTDVGALLGARFAASGYGLIAARLPAGTWDLVVFARSTQTGSFDAVRVVRVEFR